MVSFSLFIGWSHSFSIPIYQNPNILIQIETGISHNDA